MSITGRKGKLSLRHDPESAQDIVWERIEDVLTADVFGAYRYLPLGYGLVPFLSHAKDENGLTLGRYLGAQGIALGDLAYARIHFWPHFRDGSEPDLMVLLGSNPDQVQVALLVEAKLYATQHELMYQGIARSQIGHYMIQHLGSAYTSPIRPVEIPDVRPLLYITRGRVLPRQELKRARSEVMVANPELPPSSLGIFWCSWAAAGNEARRLWRKHHQEVGEKPWLRHLLDLWHDLRHRGLMPRPPFKRIPQPADFQSTWHYVPRVGIEPLLISLPPIVCAHRGLGIPKPIDCQYTWHYVSRIGVAPLQTALLPAVYRERKLNPDPLIGRLPKVAYINQGLGIPIWPRKKSLRPLSYLQERKT